MRLIYWISVIILSYILYKLVIYEKSRTIECFTVVDTSNPDNINSIYHKVWQIPVDVASATWRPVLPKATQFTRPFTALLANPSTDKYPLKQCDPTISSEVSKIDFFDWARKVTTDVNSGNNHYLTIVRDQGQCGGCWAFAAVDMLADRISIGTGGTNPIARRTSPVLLSVEDVIACSQKDSQLNGCNGGIVFEAIEWMSKNKIPTDYEYPYTAGGAGSDFSCKSKPGPYYKYQQDEDGKPQVVNLTTTAKNGVQQPYDPNNPPQLTQSQINANIVRMKCEIYERGPIATSFEVYSDFMNYNPGGSYDHGVYMHSSTATVEGGHAIEIVGWGNTTKQEKGTTLPYWIVKNSWGPNWGINGYGLIVMGRNESMIESYCVAGIPDCTFSPLTSSTCFVKLLSNVSELQEEKSNFKPSI